MGKFSTGLRRSSPTILTVLGIAGVVGTTVMAIKATPKAMKLIKAMFPVEMPAFRLKTGK